MISSRSREDAQFTEKSSKSWFKENARTDSRKKSKKDVCSSGPKRRTIDFTENSNVLGVFTEFLCQKGFEQGC